MSLTRHLISAFLLSLAVLATGCHDDKDDFDYSTLNTTPSSAAVTAFSLDAPNSVMKNIDSVFFSINLDAAEIFNADSLPVGTRTDALCINISTPTVSKAEVTFARKDLPDTTINYLENPSDSIDFSRGPVSLRIVAADGMTEVTYKVWVNVHTVEADTLTWGNGAYSALPTNLPALQEQKTVMRGATALCMGVNHGRYSVATSLDPSRRQWQVATPSLPFTPRLQTLAATPGAYYVLDQQGTLYKSDDGLQWTSTGQTGWHWIYGAYQDMVLGNGLREGQYVQRAYPPLAQETALPADMPVEGNSVPREIKVTWSPLPQIMIVGGRRADGTLSPDTYGYDGTSWAKTSVTTPLPQGITDCAVVPYWAFETSDVNWRTTQTPLYMLIGGMLADGTVNTRVYVTYNQGIIWAEGPSMLQLQPQVPPMYRLQAYVDEVTLYPTPAEDQMQIRRRVKKPVTEWSCPYIYLYGGITSDGYLSDSIWRGVVNRLTFFPVY